MAAAGRKLGDAYIAVTADASKIGDELSAKAKKALEDAAHTMGETLDEELGRTVHDSTDGLGETLGDELGKGTERAGGKFRESLTKNLTNAIKDLPDITLGADATEIDRELAGVREHLTAMKDAHIGVDLSTADALAQLTALRATLDGIGKSTADIGVRADTAAASAELAKMELEVSRLDGSTAEINVRTDTSGVDSLTGAAGRAEGGIGILMSGILGIAPALIPIGAAAVAAIGAIGPLAAGAGAGLATMLIGFSGVGDAVKLLDKRHDALASSAGKSAASQVSSAAAVESAQRSLANTVANNADAAQAAAAKVAASRQDEADAVVSALRKEQDAERALQSALRDEADAQLGLVSARRQAQQQLEDLTNSLIDNDLAQRRSAVAVAAARNALDAVLRNPRASTASRDAAQLAYDEQIQQQRELQLQAQRLQAQQVDAAAKGVDGSDVVVAAQQKLLDAQQKVGDATQGVTDAQVNGARAVADAQQKVTDALHAQETQARQAAYSMAQAQSALAQAGQSAAATGVSGAGALAAIDSELAKLDPATRAFSDYVDGTLKPVWEKLKGAAAGGLLPGVQAGLEKLQPILPQITGFISSMSSTLGGIFSDLGDELSSPFWTTFFANLQNVAGPALQAMYDAGMNVVQAIASIVSAFMPMSGEMGDGIVNLTQKFADWAAQLGDSKGFKDFIAYVQENGPKVMELLGNLADVAQHLISGMAAQGGGTLDVLLKISGAIASMDPSTLAAVADAIGGLVVAKSVVGGIGDLVQQGRDARDTYHSVKDALSTAKDVITEMPGKLASLGSAIRDSGAATKAWAAAQKILNLVMNMSPLGIVLTVIGLLVGAFITAWTTSQTFRDIVMGVLSAIGGFFVMLWDGIKAGFSWLVDFFTSAWSVITGGLQWLGGLFSSIWNGIRDAVVAVVKFLVDAVVGYFTFWWNTITAILGFIWDVITTVWNAVSGFIVGLVGGIVDWVVGAWNGLVNGIKTALGWIWDTITGIWNNIWGFITNLVGRIVDWVMGAWHGLVDGIKSAFNGVADFVGGVFSAIGTAIKSAINFIIRGVNGSVIKGINVVIDGVNFVNPFHDIPHVPPIPELAAGAVVRRATLAIIGEDGPEAVVPLSAARSGRRAAVMAEAGLSGGDGAAPLQVDARQYYTVADTQTAEEVGAVVGTRLVRDVRNGVSNAYTGIAA